MVFFNCGQCGESMRKAQVEKHYKFKCRDCQCLSCVDCGKEFWGEEYQKHIKCISEDEKYGGKDYKPKPNANKGEKKQEEWTEQVQSAINKCKDQKLRSSLEKMKEYSNIPRKKAKFENFIKNSLRVPAYLATQLWEVISAESLANRKNSADKAASVNGQDKSPAEDTVPSKACENGETKKLNKRQRKEERQKQKTRKEKKDKDVEESQQEKTADKEKKKRKRKHAEEEEEDADLAEESENLDPTPKKKRKNPSHQEENGVESGDQEEDQPSRKKRKPQTQLQDTPLNKGRETQEAYAVGKAKFNWDDVILQVLKQADGHEVRVKKLKKKVLAEYYNCNPNCHLSEEKVSVKFEKKVTKNSKFKIQKDRVKLVS